MNDNSTGHYARHGSQLYGSYGSLIEARDRVIDTLNQMLGNGHYYFTAKIERYQDQWMLTMTME